MKALHSDADGDLPLYLNNLKCTLQPFVLFIRDLLQNNILIVMLAPSNIYYVFKERLCFLAFQSQCVIQQTLITTTAPKAGRL